MRVEPQFRKRNWQYLQLKCCGVDHTYVIIFWSYSLKVFGLLLWVSGKESACSTGDTGDSGSISGSGRSSGRGNGNSTPVFLPGESHGQRSLAKLQGVHGAAKSRTWLNLWLTLKCSRLWQVKLKKEKVEWKGVWQIGYCVTSCEWGDILRIYFLGGLMGERNFGETRWQALTVEQSSCVWARTTPNKEILFPSQTTKSCYSFILHSKQSTCCSDEKQISL